MAGAALATASLSVGALVAAAAPPHVVATLPSPAAHADRIVVLGDSVATGAGCDCRPFGPRLAELLASRQHRPVRVSTLARNGLDTPALVQQVRTDAPTIDALRQATSVVVTIAANDFDESRAGSDCATAGSETGCYDAELRGLPQQLDAALLAVREATTGARILVTGYWNVFRDGVVGQNQGPAYRRTSDTLTRQVNDALRTAAASEGATYVDLFAAFRGDGTHDDTALLAPDGDHPSASGHQRIALVLADRLLAG